MLKSLVTTTNSILLVDLETGDFNPYIRPQLLPDVQRGMANFIGEHNPVMKGFFHSCPLEPFFYGMTVLKGSKYITHGSFPAVVLRLDDNRTFIPPPMQAQIMSPHQLIAVEDDLLIISA